MNDICIWFLAIVNITGAVEKANKKCTASCICAIKNYILLSCYTNVAYYFSVSQKITYLLTMIVLPMYY